MRKSVARRLKLGQEILFGDRKGLANAMGSSTMDRARVVHVTPKGGIKVRYDSGRTKWVPYHHAYGVYDDNGQFVWF